MRETHHLYEQASGPKLITWTGDEAALRSFLSGPSN
jgi:hypothetical protein